MGGVVLLDASDERLEEGQQAAEGDAALPLELGRGLLKAVGVVVGGFSEALLPHGLGGDGELLARVGRAGGLGGLGGCLESLGHALAVRASAGAGVRLVEALPVLAEGRRDAVQQRANVNLRVLVHVKPPVLEMD